MKKMILLMTVFGTIGFGAMAQTNRTYKTDMSTERIKAEEHTGGGIQSQGTVLLNNGTNNMELQGQQPLRVMDVHQWQGFRADGREYRLPTPEEFIEHTRGWDTSLTNGNYRLFAVQGQKSLPTTLIYKWPELNSGHFSFWGTVFFYTNA